MTTTKATMIAITKHETQLYYVIILSVMYFIQMMAGVGIAGGWPGIYLSSGHLRASPCDFTARASLWQPQGSYTANMTGSGYQQELSGNKAKAASPFLTQPRKSLLHFVGYRQVT